MRRVLAAFFVLLLIPGAAFADYDIGGRWLMEGGGFAEKSFVRSEMTLDGTMDIQTQTEGEDRYILGFSLTMRLNASRFNISAWKYSKVVVLNAPIPLPELRPTTNEPFVLPPVPVEGLVYEVTFTSTTSGTVKIYGNIDVDVAGKIEIDSESAIWKEGSAKPDIPDKTSGCNAGFWGVWGVWAVLAILPRTKTRKYL
jgi:hypothetical protein